MFLKIILINLDVLVLNKVWLFNISHSYHYKHPACEGFNCHESWLSNLQQSWTKQEATGTVNKLFCYSISYSKLDPLLNCYFIVSEKQVMSGEHYVPEH